MRRPVSSSSGDLVVVADAETTETATTTAGVADVEGSGRVVRGPRRSGRRPRASGHTLRPRRGVSARGVQVAVDLVLRRRRRRRRVLAGLAEGAAPPLDGRVPRHGRDLCQKAMAGLRPPATAKGHGRVDRRLLLPQVRQRRRLSTMHSKKAQRHPPTRRRLRRAASVPRLALRRAGGHLALAQGILRRRRSLPPAPNPLRLLRNFALPAVPRGLPPPSLRTERLRSLRRTREPRRLPP
mmetsp:Transcript_18491/g.59634  ORF Transcript_18491/g.59634 Transcript_18491/m.59634 type:complete len:239 (-) Transcript_18491:134-850(-)